MSYNTNIDLSGFKNIDKNISNNISAEFYKKFDNIPENFTWSKSSIHDNDEMSRKKALMSTVKNQYQCGCCWAISCATAISDAFVIKGLVDWKPNISYTYALSRYPQQKCSGGSSRILLEDIKDGDGIASDFCVDESWCLNDEKCVLGDPENHFTFENKEYLSSLIPPEGCYDGSKKHYVYNIDDVYSMTVSENLKVFEMQLKMKQHIMIRGPLVGGFLVMENFPNGNFVNFDKSIYFEKGNYSGSELTFDFIPEKNILGSHSVVIVGWGISKNTLYKEKYVNIPYWYCRNSWGVSWGENGYFKLAMYPYNKICQFSKQIQVLSDGAVKTVGGITGFNVINKPILKNLKSNNVKYKFLKNIKENYSTSENLIYGKPDNSNYFISITIIIIVLLLNY